MMKSFHQTLQKGEFIDLKLSKKDTQRSIYIFVLYIIRSMSWYILHYANKSPDMFLI